MTRGGRGQQSHLPLVLRWVQLAEFELVVLGLLFVVLYVIFFLVRRPSP